MIDKVKDLIKKATWTQQLLAAMCAYNAFLTIMLLVLVCYVVSDHKFLYTHVHGGPQQQQQDDGWASWFSSNKVDSSKCPSCNGSGRSTSQ